MKGYRFYAEMPQDRKSKSASKAFPFFPWTVVALRARAADGFRCDVVAVDLEISRCSANFEGVGVAIEGNRNSYCVTAIAPDYLSKRCVRIPEDLARVLSPELFRYLES